MWRDNLLKYEKGSLKINRTSARHDFSGTNYRSCTLGWLAGIQQKRQTDKMFFAKVCEEAQEIALSVTGKSKLSNGPRRGDQYSDCEIADRAGIQSDESKLDESELDESELNEEVTANANRKQELSPDHEPEGLGLQEESSRCNNKKSQTTPSPSVDGTEELQVEVRGVDDSTRFSDLSELEESDASD